MYTVNKRTYMYINVNVFIYKPCGEKSVKPLRAARPLLGSLAVA